MNAAGLHESHAGGLAGSGAVDVGTVIGDGTKKKIALDLFSGTGAATAAFREKPGLARHRHR